jgi:hypothetical protein
MSTQAAAEMLRSEYHLEIGAGCDEHPTQVATPRGARAGAVNDNASEALRAPISAPLPAVSGADETAPARGSGPSETAGGEQAFLI